MLDDEQMAHAKISIANRQRQIQNVIFERRIEIKSGERLMPSGARQSV
jgi:hypothetical protein